MRVLDNPLTAFNLKVFCTLMEEKSVTHAAGKLQLSQPATSLVLKQLREIFGDPLLMRSDGRMVPTERALMLRDAAARVLADLNELIIHPSAFDPENLHQTFTLAIGSNLSPSLLADFVGEVTRLAPAVRLVMRRARSGSDAANLISSGAADVAIGCWNDPSAQLRRAILFEEDVVCLIDQAHPFALKTPTLLDYASARHLMLSEGAEDAAGTGETHVAALRVAGEQKTVACDYMMAPYLLVGSDLVLTINRSFAMHFAGILPLAVLACPVTSPHAHFYQVWHERCEYSPAQRWLRETLAAACRITPDTTPPSPDGRRIR